MRTAFVETLFELAEKDERIMVVTGDLGFGVLVPFWEKLPKQFVNVGVAEQNMTGLAAGLAFEGKIVFTYSIANFPVVRPMEQIRNDICYHKANVRITAVGGGFTYGALGMTHQATEDIALMRSLPNMTVVAPGDPVEAELATRALIDHQGPAYLRLGRTGEPLVHDGAKPEFRLGKAVVAREGDDITLVSTGGMLYNSMGVAEELASEGIGARVLSMHTVKPIDREAVQAAGRETSAVFTVEEHNIVGGLGSAVAETLLESPSRPSLFKRIGLPDIFNSTVGDREYILEHHGLDVRGIAATIRRELKELKHGV